LTFFLGFGASSSPEDNKVGRFVPMDFATGISSSALGMGDAPLSKESVYGGMLAPERDDHRDLIDAISTSESGMSKMLAACGCSSSLLMI